MDFEGMDNVLIHFSKEGKLVLVEVLDACKFITRNSYRDMGTRSFQGCRSRVFKNM